MSIEFKKYDEGIFIENVKDFEFKHIFDCGQCFRWKEDEDGTYAGVVSNKVVRVIKEGNNVLIKGGKIEDSNFWINYFDLSRDYSKIKQELSNDAVLKESIKFGEGMRILNQDAFEIVISFIISANNRILMIKRAVENISKNFGKEILFENNIYYSFPNIEDLINAKTEDFQKCGCGFRAPYLVETIKILNEDTNLLKSISCKKTDEGQSELIKLKGIGPKVADCILLFSMGKTDAFPVDVWVKRAMQHYYVAPDVSLKKIREFGREQFGDYAGFAQQYLFYYMREQKGKETLKK